MVIVRLLYAFVKFLINHNHDHHPNLAYCMYALTLDSKVFRTDLTLLLQGSESAAGVPSKAATTTRSFHLCYVKYVRYFLSQQIVIQRHRIHNAIEAIHLCAVVKVEINKDIQSSMLALYDDFFKPLSVEDHGHGSALAPLCNVSIRVFVGLVKDLLLIII